MQKRFTNREKTAIRHDFSGHQLYQLVESVLPVVDPQLQNINIAAEELFYCVISIIDNIKEQGETFEIDVLWKSLNSEYRSLDSTIPEGERQTLVCLIVIVCSILLTASNDGVHQSFGEDLVFSAEAYYPEVTTLYRTVFDSCSYLEDDVTQWINEYMSIDNHEYLSDMVSALINGLPSDSTSIEHPLAPYIRRGDKVDQILDWLHRAIIGETQPKCQIAPIKAAMECKPQAVHRNLPVDVFNKEFCLNISKGTWDNWISGYHGNSYTEEDIKDYKAELDEIMK